jgi:hypothetical protein
VCRGHVGSGLRAVGRDGFTCGVPAAVECLEAGLLTCGCMRRPPVSELLVPALGLSGAAEPAEGSPYGGLCVGVHHDLKNIEALASYGVTALILGDIGIARL